MKFDPFEDWERAYVAFSLTRTPEQKAASVARTHEQILEEMRQWRVERGFEE